MYFSSQFTCGIVLKQRSTIALEVGKSPTAARHADKYDAAVPVYTAYNDSHQNARKYHTDSQAPENTSHFAMRITLFSSLPPSPDFFRLDTLPAAQPTVSKH